VKIVSVRAVPDVGTLEKLAEDVVAGRLTIPIDRMVPLADAGKAQVAAEKGGIGKILLLA
jgi:NADPH:quinone reductase-like Zn-dependent oxidoreductase